MKNKEYIETLRIRDEIKHNPWARILFKIVVISYPILLISMLAVRFPDIQQFFPFNYVADFIPSLAELISVFVGVAFAFVIDRIYTERKNKKDNMNVFYMIISELEENMKYLDSLYNTANISYIPYMMKTNIYDIYEDSLRTFSMWNVEELTEIYHNLNLINENIKKYPKTNDMPVNQYTGTQDREKIREIRINTIYNIKKWISVIKTYYEEKEANNFPISKGCLDRLFYWTLDRLSTFFESHSTDEPTPAR